MRSRSRGRRRSRREVVDFGADELSPGDNHPDFVIPLANAVAAGSVEVAWDLVQTFLAAKFTHAQRHVRRLSKVAQLELQATRTNR